MKLQYSPDAVDRLKEIKAVFGKKIYQNIRTSIKGLSTMPEKGAPVENYINIPNPYRWIHISQHYIFYRINTEKNIVYITDIFNEREDFLYVMFGISLRTKESIDYWGE